MCCFQKQAPEIKKGILKILAKFTGKHFSQSLFFNKVAADLRSETLLNSGTVVFLWILRNFQEHLFYRTPPSDYFSLKKPFIRFSEALQVRPSYINPFLADVPILYPLKTPEKLWFSGLFREYKRGTLVKNGLKTCF